MKIYIGSDHAGYEMKEHLKIYFNNLGYEIIDKGAFELDNDDDYPDFIKSVAVEVASNISSFGIILGGSGQGEAMCANRTLGIRASVYYGGNEEIIKLSREHNNSNILSIGARFISNTEAERVIDLWIKTKFSNDERHIRRLNKF